MTEASSADAGGWRTALASLQLPQFRFLFASNLAFFLAMQGQGLVRSYIVYELTDSKLALGTVSASMAVAMLLGAPLGGVMADRVERRRLIVMAQCVAIASELAFFTLLVREQLAFWEMVALAFVMGCTFPLIMPARNAIIVNIVGRKGLCTAIALNMAGVNVMRVVGPAAAGFLIAIIGSVRVYAIDLVLYGVGVLAMLGVGRVDPAEGTNEVSVLHNLMDGFRYVAKNRLVFVLLLYGLVPMFLAMPFQTLLVVFAEDVWKVGTSGLGILNAAAGIGGIAGSFYVASRSTGAGRLKLMMASAVAFGGLLTCFSMSPWFWPAVAAVLGANVYASVFQTLNNTAIQLVITDDVRGRISSFLMMSFSLPMLGTLPVSALAESVGAPLAVAAASAAAIVVAVLFYLFSPALRRLDDEIRSEMARA